MSRPAHIFHRKFPETMNRILILLTFLAASVLSGASAAHADGAIPDPPSCGALPLPCEPEVPLCGAILVPCPPVPVTDPPVSEPVSTGATPPVDVQSVSPSPKMGPGQVEDRERHVKRVNVTYAEPMPTVRFPARHYFETNDGAAYRYVSNGSCERANLVPNRLCHTVFWYAR